MWQKLAVSMMYEENMDKPSRNSQVVGGVGQHLKNQVDGHMHPTTPAAFMTDDGQNPIPSYISPMPMITNDHLFSSSPLIHRPSTLHQIVSPSGAELGAHVRQPGRKGPETTNTSAGCWLAVVAAGGCSGSDEPG